MSNRAPARQAGFLVVGQNIASLAEALVLLAVVRLMGKADVGALGGLLLVYQTIALMASAGFPAALMYFLPARPSVERRALAWQFAKTLLLLGGAAGMLLVAIAAAEQIVPQWLSSLQGVGGGSLGSSDHGSFRYLYLMALYPLADIPTRMLNNLLVVEQRAQVVAGTSMIRALGQTLATVVPIALGANLWVVVGSLTAWGYLYGSSLIYFLGSLYRGVPSEPSPIATRKIFAFALPIAASTVVSLVNSRLDHYLILFSFSKERFAEYQAGAWQIPVVTSLVYPVGAAFMPRFRELFAEGKPGQAIEVWRQMALRVSNLVVPISVSFIVAAEETMRLLFTESYTAGAGVFRWYTLWTMGRVATFGNVLTAAGQPRSILKAALVAVTVNAVISPLMLWWVGFEGPALGTVLAFVPEVLIYCWYISKASGLPLGRTFPLGGYAKAVAVGLVAAAPAVWLKQAVPLPAGLSVVLTLVVVLAGYTGVGFAVGVVTRSDLRFLAAWVLPKRYRSARPDSE